MRLMNTETNPLIGMLPRGHWGSGIYQHGQPFPPGLEGGTPTWVYSEFPIVAAFDTADSSVVLPDDFTLLTVLRYAVGSTAFKLWLYDENRRWALMERTVNDNAHTSRGENPLFLKEPYQFLGPSPTCNIRVVNQTNAQADIMIALYGVVGGVQ